MDQPYLQACGPGRWRLLVWVQPGARKNEVAGLYRSRLKIRLVAPAVDGKANKALALFVAKLLGVRPNELRLEAGLSSRAKTLCVACDRAPDWGLLGPTG